MCNGEGALLHGQLVKFGKLLEYSRKTKTKNEGGKMGKEKFKAGILKLFPFFVSGYSDMERKI